MDHKGLEAWKQAMQLVEDVYGLTRSLPSEEIYGLTSQMRRAAVSIPSNIAEGAARQSDRELMHFLSISLGSLAELETQLILSERLGYVVEVERITDQLRQVRSLVVGLRNYLRKKM